jgi:hypothetical protein
MSLRDSREHIGQASLTRQLAEQAGTDRLTS